MFNTRIPTRISSYVPQPTTDIVSVERYGYTDVFSPLGHPINGSHDHYVWYTSDTQNGTYSSRGNAYGNYDMIPMTNGQTRWVKCQSQSVANAVLTEWGPVQITNSVATPAYTRAQPGWTGLVDSSGWSLVGGWMLDVASSGSHIGFTPGGFTMFRGSDAKRYFIVNGYSATVHEFDAGGPTISTDRTTWRRLTSTHEIRNFTPFSGMTLPTEGIQTRLGGVYFDADNLTLYTSIFNQYAADNNASYDTFCRTHTYAGSDLVNLPTRTPNAEIQTTGLHSQMHGKGFMEFDQTWADANLGGKSFAVCGGGYESGQNSAGGPTMTLADRGTLANRKDIIRTNFGDGVNKERRPGDYVPVQFSTSQRTGWMNRCDNFTGALPGDSGVGSYNVPGTWDEITPYSFDVGEGYWQSGHIRGNPTWYDSNNVYYVANDTRGESWYDCQFFDTAGRTRFGKTFKGGWFPETFGETRFRTNYLYSYKPDDIAAVNNNTLSSSAIRGYYSILPYLGTVSGCHYDATDGWLYVMYKSSLSFNSNPMPCIAVFERV